MIKYFSNKNSLIFHSIARAGLNENDCLIEVDDQDIEHKSSKGNSHENSIFFLFRKVFV
jgi:hypothetical protein